MQIYGSCEFHLSATKFGGSPVIFSDTMNPIDSEGILKHKIPKMSLHSLVFNVNCLFGEIRRFLYLLLNEQETRGAFILG